MPGVTLSSEDGDASLSIFVGQNLTEDSLSFLPPFLKFMWLHRVLVAGHGIFVETCGMFPCDAQALWVWLVGSEVAVCGATCPTARGVLVPSAQLPSRVRLCATSL